MDVGFTVTSLGFETVPIMSVQALEIGERPRRNMENVLTLRYLVRTMLRAGGVGGGGAGGGAGGNGDQGGGDGGNGDQGGGDQGGGDQGGGAGGNGDQGGGDGGNGNQGGGDQGGGDQGGGGVEVVKVIVVVMKVGLVVLVLVVGHVDRHAINVVDNMVYCVNFRQDH